MRRLLVLVGVAVDVISGFQHLRFMRRLPPVMMNPSSTASPPA
jgi:hypothetical protein